MQAAAIGQRPCNLIAREDLAAGTGGDSRLGASYRRGDSGRFGVNGL